MKLFFRIFLSRLVMVLLFATALGAFVPTSRAQEFVVTNDDNAALNTATVFHTTASPYTMTQVAGSPFSTGSHGLGSYYAGSVTNAISSHNCVFISDAMGVKNDGVSDIAAFVATPRFALTLKGNFVTPNHDSGSLAGVGLAISGNFLYASYTTTGSIAVWQINGGCTLQYKTKINSTGLNGGTAIAMAATPNGKTLIVTYDDGSMGAFAVGTGGITAENEILSAGFERDGGIPASVFIDSAGVWAIFADFSASGGPTEIDVAPITTSGLGTPAEYGGPSGSLGTNNVVSYYLNLSPDNTALYVNGLSSGTVQSLSFNETTGAVTTLSPCLNSGTVPMTGFGTIWTAPGIIATLTATGKGGGIYVALGGGTDGVSSYIDILTVNKQGCLLEQPSAPGPPAGHDPNGSGMYSMSGVPRKNPIGEK